MLYKIFRQRRAAALLGLILFLTALSPLIAALDKNPHYSPLVNTDEWTVTGGMFKFDTAPSNNLDIPRQIRISSASVFWRSWSPSTGGTVGSVISSPFILPRHLAIPYHGFPKRTPGDRIYLKVDGGEELEIATTATLSDWATVFLDTPQRLEGREARLIANAASTAQYVAVGTPFEVPASVTVANSGFAPRLAVVFFTWATFVIVGLVVAASLSKATDNTVPLIMLGLGVLGTAAFILVNLAAAHFATWLTCFLGFAAARFFWLVQTRPEYVSRAIRSAAAPTLTWLAVAIICCALTTIIDNGGGRWVANGMFLPATWSSDNQLSFLFAESLFNGESRDKIVWGPWLASDRTPLMTELLLIPRATIIKWIAPYLGCTFIPLGYMAASITILSSWAAILVWLARKAGCRRPTMLIIVVFCCPFIAFNTVYTWPKMLGASYVVLAFGVAYFRKDNPNWLIVIAASASLAFLSHASNVFALVPICIIFLPAILRSRYGEIGIAASFALAFALPWFAWQHIFQPNADVLLRYALAGDFGFEKRGAGIAGDVTRAYYALGLEGWWNAKLAGMKLMLGIANNSVQFQDIKGLDADLLGRQRVVDFFILIRTLGVSVLGLVLILLSIRKSISALSAVAGLAGILLTFAVTLPQPVVHHLPYGSILLLIFAGGLAIANANRIIAYSSCIIGLVYFLSVWVADPMSRALRVNFDYSTGASLLLAVLIGGYAAALRYDCAGTRDLV